MRNLITNYLKEIAKNKTKRRRIQMIVSMLSLAVALTVFWQLRIVGISMTGEALCGKLEHTHTLDCLVMQNVCGLEEAEEHVHTEECYIAETVQICQKEVHSHSDDCLMKLERSCNLEEHQHGEACIVTEEVQICQDETEEHEHVPACYEIQTNRKCEKEEHAHTEGQCYVQIPCVCEIEEHQHDVACFETKDKLVCDKDETEGHTHTPECQREVNGCGYEEEHRHTLLCYADAEADLETSADWEASLPALTGNAREDLVAVANSQLGYAESEQNYKVADDDTTKMGYTRYGEWYGNPYGNWNAMFVSFCLNYSNHPDYAALKNTGVETMRQAAISAGKYTAVKPDLVPSDGSIVFLDKDSSGSADRAAVVTYAGNGVISVVEGDYNGTVAEMEYSMGNGTIMGYALLPAREPQILTSANPNSNNVQPAEDGYVLHYTCGCSGNHDVGVSDYDTPVELDQSLYDLPIPTVAAVNDQSCDNYGKIFTGWYVRNTNDETIAFNADMSLVADYAENGTINVYARWAAPVGDAVTVTFVVDEKTTKTVFLNAGAPLDEGIYWIFAPVVEDGSGKIFDGWQTEDKTVIEQDTIITADITLYPRIEDIVTVRFEYDCADYEDVDKQIAWGTALGEVLYELDTEVFADRKFLGWVVKGSEGSTDYLTPETLIYEDTTYVPAFGDIVTLTFMNGEAEFGVVRNVPQGAYVWDYLPQETPLYTGTSEQLMEFAGWGRMNGETPELVSETAVAETDMVLYAVFKEVPSVKVYLHDMAPDGVTDYEQEAQKGRINLPVDMPLQTYLNSKSYRMHRDGKLAAECKWYIKQTVDGNEDYVAYTLESPVETELHLYTFHYTVTLTRQNAATASLDVSDDGNTLTLTLREGEKPTAADFVVNGVDYTLYQWTYMDGNQQKTLKISQIIANGVSENITAVSAGKQTTVSKRIWFYAIVNNERVLLSSDPVSCVRIGNRYYVTAALLEELYADFGFTAEMLRPGTRYFPHAAAGDANGIIWADADVVEQDGLYYSPVVGDDKNADVYYLPHQTLSGGSGAYTQFLTTDTFYTITISDPTNIFFGTDEEIPPVQYVLTGGTATVTLPSPSEENGTRWLWKGNPLTGTSNADGTTTYTFSDVTEPIQIVAIKDNQVDITYDINLGSYDPASTEPTINGGKTYLEPVQLQEDGRYIVRTPSRLRFTIDDNNALKTILFKGWAINGDPNQMLNAGEILSAVQLRQYGNVRLVAQWEEQSFSYGVSFYVNLGLHVVDYNGDSVPTTDNKDYTSALYGTTLKISPAPTSFPNSVGTGNYVGDGGGVVLAGTDTAAIDSMIRQFATQSITAKYGSGDDYIDREFTLDSFPDDEQLLVEIRNLQAGYIADYQAWKQSHPYGTVNDYRAADSDNKIIAIDGEYIPSEELTENNYTIRWFVFKHDTGNGWHIDGTLVKKQGQITVQKTFSGYDPAIAEVIDPNRENPYHISVKDDTNKTVTTLILSNTDTTDGMGYQSYDAATKTYTWVVPLTAGKTFTFFENNYASREVVGGDTVASLAEYMVTNSTSDVYRTKYNPANGVSVMARGHNVDQSYSTYETVTFFNSYIPTAAVPLSKVDDYGNPLPGVSFSLHKDGEKCEIYKDRAGIYYIYEPTDKETALVDGGYITVDQQGYALVMGLKDVDENGNYSDYIFELEESVTPGGYASVDAISFEITDQGEIRLTGDTTSVTLVDGEVLRVTNASKTMDVTVVKNWEGQKETVVVQLVQNGNPLISKTATLNDENGWTYTWEDMPIYVSGALAEYTIKETWIGETAYRGTYDDGYEGYIVVVLAPETVDEDGDGLPERATITVNNSVYLGGLQFKKIDEKGVGLARALFQLYTVETCEHIGSGEPCEHAYGDGVWSDPYGNVNFGALAVGTYYLREVKSPAGYEPNYTVYKVVVSGSGTTLTVNGSDTPISVIANIPSTIDLKVRKVDDNGDVLSGAIFRVYMYNEDSKKYDITVARNGLTQYTSDHNGMLTVPELLPGNYKLIEVTAPAGYYRMAEEIDFTVALARINVTSESTNENSWSFDEKDTVTVVNVLGTELPQTGGMGTHYGTMAGLLMMAGSLLYIFLLRRKRERRGAV